MHEKVLDVIPDTPQLSVLHFNMMPQVKKKASMSVIPASSDQVSCWLIGLLQQHASESLSNLDYSEFNETRARFLFT